MRRSRREAETAQVIEASLRRSRIEEKIANDRIVREEALRRSRIEAEIDAARSVRENALIRSRIEADHRADQVLNVLAKSRLESALQYERLEHEKAALNESIRRSRIGRY